MNPATFYFSTLLLLFLLITGFCVQAQDTLQAKAYADTALVLLKAGEYDRSFYYYQRGGEIYKKAERDLDYGKSLYGMGLALHYNKKNKEALTWYESSLKVLEKLLPETDPYIMDLYNNIGGVLINLGRRFESRQYLEKAFALNAEVYGEDHKMTAITHYNLGLSCLYFGENRLSLEHFMKAMPVYLREYGENGAGVAQLYTNVGILYRDLGDYDHAKDYFERGITIHLESHGENYWNLAYPYANLAEVFYTMNEKDVALDYYLKTLALCEDNPKYLKRLESITNGVLARYYSEKGEYEKSLAYANKAIEIIKENYYDEHPRLNDYYRIIGDAYRKQRDFTTANQWFEKAAENVSTAYGFIHPKLAEVYRKQAEMYLEMGDHEKALQTLQAGIHTISPEFTSLENTNYPVVGTVLDEKMYMHLITDKGYVFQQRAEISSNAENDLNTALEHYILAAEIIDHIRRGYLSEGSKLFLQENAVAVYEKAISVCKQLHLVTQEAAYLNKAFFFMEKSKSVVLSEALQASALNTVQGIPQQVLAEEEEIDRYIRSIVLKLADAQTEENDSVQVVLRKELFHAKIKNDSLMQAIQQNHPDYHHLKYNTEVVSTATIQGQLGEYTAMLSYFEGDSSWYVCSLSKNRAALWEVPHDSLLSNDLNNFREAVSNPLSEITDFSSGAYRIFEKLVAMPLQDHQNIHNIIVVPDGMLGYLPFDALLTQPFEDGDHRPHYLIEDYTLSYANSVTLLSQSVDRPTKPQITYAGFAPEYPENLVASKEDFMAYRDVLAHLSGTREEVSFAGEIFSGITFLEQQATEFNFKQLGKSPAILHLAMHALVDDQDPMRSRLLFTDISDSVEDARLHAYEIYNLKLGSNLAVLSACNTGYGEVHRGEGIMSLSRAFMYAGCPSIVMSLWRAKDQPTTQIISGFFENLKEEMPKDEALRLAKLNYLQKADPLKAHPANWATFVLLGNAEPVQPLSTAKKWWMSGILFIIFSTTVFFYLRKRKATVLSG